VIYLNKNNTLALGLLQENHRHYWE